jgi:hypothetical protein
VKIAGAANVEVPSYLALHAKGYEVTVVRRATGEETWHAEKDDNRFSAEGLVELLGVVGMFEIRGDNWKASDDQIDEFMRRYNI